MVNIALSFMIMPLLVAIVGTLSEKYNKAIGRDLIAILTSLAIFGGVYRVYTILNQTASKILVVYIGAGPPLGACFEIDLFSVYIAFSVAALGILVTFYSLKYMEHDGRLTEYYTMLINTISKIEQMKGEEALPQQVQREYFNLYLQIKRNDN